MLDLSFRKLEWQNLAINEPIPSTPNFAHSAVFLNLKAFPSGRDEIRMSNFSGHSV